MVTENVEEYLEAIYTLTEEGKRARTSEVAKHLNIAPSSVSEMLRKLSSEGYIDYEPYKGVTLTKNGLEVAKKIKRKHRLLERFLSDVLKIKKEEVHEHACKMEHSLSDEVEEALCKVLKFPDTCPDDDKTIPLCNKEVTSCLECVQKESTSFEKRKKELIPLSSLKVGQKGIVAFIRGGRGVVQRLVDLGLCPNTEIEVLRIAPLAGPIEICVRGSNLAIGRGIASKVFVETR
ncbi:MAG: metal-dependent transcriptional regulator [Methanocellales archaeon]